MDEPINVQFDFYLEDFSYESEPLLAKNFPPSLEYDLHSEASIF